jgi:hypothetical protein
MDTLRKLLLIETKLMCQEMHIKHSKILLQQSSEKIAFAKDRIYQLALQVESLAKEAARSSKIDCISFDTVVNNTFEMLKETA